MRGILNSGIYLTMTKNRQEIKAVDNKQIKSATLRDLRRKRNCAGYK
ncbi:MULTISPECIES: hypothetical protein [Psychrilyobacter]|nr:MULTISPECIES: hypothetical protein [Psychrilyobacter]NDI79303.1 hypothetical protein [Psychrilyobacter piezotolerans]